MGELERDFRSHSRIVRMEIRTVYGRSRSYVGSDLPNETRKILWGVFNGDIEQTRLLYVFSGPGRLAGTSLLMHDHADLAQPDSMWLYLRSFDIFRTLEPEKLKIMVPGTTLSYEDSRGFIPGDKFSFSQMPSLSAPAAAGEVILLGCPRDRTIRENIGYDSILVRVDRNKKLVRQVDYADLGGKPLKSYRLIRESKHGDRWLPSEVRLAHHSDGFVSTINYEHWPPRRSAARLVLPTQYRRGELHRSPHQLSRAGRSRHSYHRRAERRRRKGTRVGGEDSAAAVGRKGAAAQVKASTSERGSGHQRDAAINQHTPHPDLAEGATAFVSESRAGRRTRAERAEAS